MNLYKITKLGHYDGWGSEAKGVPRSQIEIEKSHFSYKTNELKLKNDEIELKLINKKGNEKILLLNEKIINLKNITDIHNTEIKKLNNDIKIELDKLKNLGANINNIKSLKKEFKRHEIEIGYLKNENYILLENFEGLSKDYIQEETIENLKTINYHKEKQIDILYKLRTTLNKKYSHLLKVKNKYIENLTIKYNSEKSNFTEKYIKTSNKNLSKYVERTVIEGINLSDGLNSSEIAILRKQPDKKINELIIEDYTKINKILNNGFNGATKSDIALFQIYAKQSGFYLKSENSRYKIDGILGNGTRKALNTLSI